MGQKLTYMGGFAEGKPKQEVKVDVDRKNVKFEHGALFGPWKLQVPLASLAEVSVAQVDSHFSLKKFAVFGVFNMKKGVHALSVAYTDETGFRWDGVFTGDKKDLEKARNEILKARGKLPKTPPVATEPTPEPPASPADNLKVLVEMHEQSLLTDEEFEAKKAELLSRL